MQYLSYLFIFLAAILNAFMDTSTDHYNLSIFSKLDPKFWAMQISWQYSKTILGYHIDAWHIAKSSMVISILLAIIFYRHINIRYDLINILILSAIWNVVFNLFYNLIFVRKKF